MQALETPETPVDSRTAARNRLTAGHRFLVCCAAVVAFLAVSTLAATTARAQQGWSRPASGSQPSASSQVSPSSNVPAELLQQLRGSGRQSSTATAERPAAAQDSGLSFRAEVPGGRQRPTTGEAAIPDEIHETREPDIRQVVAYSQEEFPAESSRRALAETEDNQPGVDAGAQGIAEQVTESTAEPVAEPELFLDLTQKSSSPTEDGPSSAAARKSTDVTADSGPIQVLMRAVAWIVIALCLGCLIVLGLRHWQRQRGLLPTTSSRSRVLETLSLGPGRTVSLIELAGFRAIVASDSGGIRSLILAPTSFQEELMQVDPAADLQVSAAGEG